VPANGAELWIKLEFRATELAAEPDHYATDQFNNPYVVPAHRENLGRRSGEQTGGRVTAFCQGVGTGESVVGVGQALEPDDVIVTIAVDSGFKYMVASYGAR
jgi:cysteine synthase